MRAGLLRRRLTFQQRADGTNAHGEPDGAWQDQFTVWGAVDDETSAELLRSTTVTEQTTAVVRLRWRTGINPDMRIVDDTGRTLHIVGPAFDPDGRRRELAIPCKEITP